MSIKYDGNVINMNTKNKLFNEGMYNKIIIVYGSWYNIYISWISKDYTSLTTIFYRMSVLSEKI